MICEKVGFILRELRAIRGESQREIARRAGINYKTLWCIEHGRWDSVRLYTFETLLNALGYELAIKEIDETEDREQIQHEAVRLSVLCESYAKRPRRDDGSEEEECLQQ